MNQINEITHHVIRPDWLKTSLNEPRGYIQPQSLKELWFHTGTICNLSCPFCLEGSKPGDDRLNQISLEDVTPFMTEALSLGVEKFSFTGGEPFVIRDILKILDYALDFRPCMVLTNATQPLFMRLKEIAVLKNKLNTLNFRVSLDYPDPKKHDQARGQGNFELALKTLGELYRMKFGISIARQRTKGEQSALIDKWYQPFFKIAGIPVSTRIVSFPEFLTPGKKSSVPEITENCMRTYQTEETRAKFMCNFSKMLVKRDGKMKIYACTLVDDDIDYEMGNKLTESMKIRVMLKHHRCYVCFSQGASCSEM